MKKIIFSEMRRNLINELYEIKEMLEQKVADYLDVNWQHINVINIETNIIGEDYFDWSENPDDACEGVQSETYYYFQYQYKEKIDLDYEEPVGMIWQHLEGTDYLDGFADNVLTEEDYDKLFEQKKKDPCSIWYVKHKNNEYLN